MPARPVFASIGALAYLAGFFWLGYLLHG